MARLRQTGSVQDSLGALTIGDGYLLRSDRVAVALIELTPPDLRLYDTDSLTRLLGMYSDVLRACPDRCSLATFALPLTITPLIQTLGGAQQRPDLIRAEQTWRRLHAQRGELAEQSPGTAQRLLNWIAG